MFRRCSIQAATTDGASSMHYYKAEREPIPLRPDASALRESALASVARALASTSQKILASRIDRRLPTTGSPKCW
jgi:hypothetical protein